MARRKLHSKRVEKMEKTSGEDVKNEWRRSKKNGKDKKTSGEDVKTSVEDVFRLKLFI